MSTATPQAIPTQVDDAPRTSGAVTTADTSASHLNRDGDVANPPIPTDNGASLRKLRLDVIKLAWPVVVEQLLSTAVGIADVAITGRLGPSALAGSGVSLQIMFIAFSALSAFGIGTTVVVAQATGARTPAVAGNALRQGMVLGTIFSLLLTCVGWLITEPLIALAGGTGDVAEAGVTVPERKPPNLVRRKRCSGRGVSSFQPPAWASVAAPTLHSSMLVAGSRDTYCQ